MLLCEHYFTNLNYLCFLITAMDFFLDFPNIFIYFGVFSFYFTYRTN